jgi:hypothetical protein
MRRRTIALVAFTTALAGAVLWRSWTGTTTAGFCYWLIACIAGELLWIRLPLGAATISMASCFNFAALLVLAPGEAMAVTALGTLVAELSLMRKPPRRAIFNAAQTGLAVAAAASGFAWVGGGSRDLVALLSGFNLLPFMAAAGLYYVVNRGAVSLAVASSTGVTPVAAWRANFGTGYELLASGAVLSLGALLAAHYEAIGMAGTLLVVLPLILACDGLRRFTRRERPAAESEQARDRAA